MDAAFRLDVVLAAVVVAVGLLGAAALLASRLAVSARERREDAFRARLAGLVSAFGVASASVEDPKAVLAWHPLVATARRALPAEFLALDGASDGTFPFGAEQIHAAHARWTADWLAWELAHDAEYKLRAAMLDEELGASKHSPLGRARLDGIEREKLARYQQRYAEYTRISRALQALMS